MTAAQGASSGYGLSEYFDEAFTPVGEIRPAYLALFEGLEHEDLPPVQDRVRTHLREAGVEFGPEGMRSAFEVDSIPRIIPSDEWSSLTEGLRQRVRALQMFLADIYDRQEIISAGVMRKSILDGAPHYEPLASGFGTPVVADLAGPDLVRDESGYRVLEDNLRFPSGLVFASAARNAVTSQWRIEGTPGSGEEAFATLGEMLRAKDPGGSGDPSVAILSEGPGSAAWFEHRSIARLLEVDLVTPQQLEVKEGRLLARTDSGSRAIDVLYNRSNTDRLTAEGDSLTPLGDLLVDPLRSGTLACVNSFGAGIADDKAIHCYTTEMIRFYLGEEPLIEIPDTYDLGDPDQASEAMEQLDRLVIKPRWELGGQDIVIGPRATQQELDQARESVKSDPGRYVAQEMVGLSTHPTVFGSDLEPRHVDLRPYVITSEGEQSLAPLALTRFARGAGDLVVNSTQGGGAKDTWIPAE